MVQAFTIYAGAITLKHIFNYIPYISALSIEFDDPLVLTAIARREDALELFVLTSLQLLLDCKSDFNLFVFKSVTI